MAEGDDLMAKLALLLADLQTLDREVKSFQLYNIPTLYKELDGTVSAVAALKKKFKEAKSNVKAAGKAGADISELNTIIDELEPLIKAVSQKFVPATGSLFVRLYLGRVNVNEICRDGERYRLKSEYEKFRSRTNPLVIFMCCLQLLFPHRYLIQGLFQVWLVYYYTTLALREQILRVNGSNINRWWIFHHYFSIIASTIVITWRWNSESYIAFYPLLMKYGAVQGFVQILVNRYQIGRLYNLVARGEASRMDVTAEIVDNRFVVSMGVLLPFLVTMNCFQFYTCYLMISYYIEYSSVWQLLAVGILFGIFAIGNVWTTLGTSFSKFGRNKKKEE